MMENLSKWIEIKKKLDGQFALLFPMINVCFQRSILVQAKPNFQKLYYFFPAVVRQFQQFCLFLEISFMFFFCFSSKNENSARSNYEFFLFNWTGSFFCNCIGKFMKNRVFLFSIRLLPPGRVFLFQMHFFNVKKKTIIVERIGFRLMKWWGVRAMFVIP